MLGEYDADLLSFAQSLVYMRVNIRAATKNK